MRLLGISGSLRESSTNTRLLLAAARLAPPDVALHMTGLVSRLPLFNPDLEPAGIDVVDAWVREIREAEGVVVSTPEYARGYPGALKNALDWLVASDAFIDKPFMLLRASSRSSIGHDSLTYVLQTMSGIHVAGASATVPLLGTTMTVDEILANPDFAKRLRDSLSTFAAEISGRGARLGAPDTANTIRPYQETDEADVTALWGEAFPTSPTWNDPRLDIQRKLSIQRDLFLVALVDGKVAGTAMAGYDGHRGWVYYVAVSASYRRQGVGTGLMKRVEEGLRAIGCPKLNLQVRPGNSEAVRFYESLGYLVEDRVSMGKLLAGS